MSKRLIATPRAVAAFVLLLCFCTAQAKVAKRTPSAPASITVDTSRVEGRISPLLYGQFIEFMFEGI